MVKCKICGFENDESSMVCLQCGNKLADVSNSNDNISHSQVDTKQNNDQPIKQTYQEYGNQQTSQEENNQTNYQQQSYHYQENQQNYQQENNQQYDYQSNNQQYNNNPEFDSNNMRYDVKSPLLAVIFGLIISGGGYMYLGKWGDGFLMLILVMILDIIGLFTVGIGIIIALIFQLYGIYDSYQKVKLYNEGKPVPSLEYSLKHIKF
ncbi:hypothetical protein [uncultured Methanosphaera sp.]|uniref:hypothetical protein n=1 Tax=uncultured Methanosphaera sp. TaxID=262501 RepID=UPI000DC2F57D|nr:hypothetical protein [uncultured Methanosphaera sp.]RAP44039.1 MAG: hypothetical protein BZ134_04685 [Methanosphaera sp. SHI1033]